MEILICVTDCLDRVIIGKALELTMPNDEGHQQFLEVLAETFEESVLQMKNGDHIMACRH